MNSKNTTSMPELPRISDYVAHWAAQTPDRTSFRFGDEEGSYAELSSTVERWARAMLASGITKGDRVSMLSTPRPEYVFSFLAAVSIGAIWVGLNPRYTPAEVTRTLRDAEPSLIFTLKSFEGADLSATLQQASAEADSKARLVIFGGADDGYETLDSFLAGGGTVTSAELDQARKDVGPSDPALIVYTSGSTGVPKGAMIPHRGLCFGYRIQNEHFGLTGGSMLCNLPINHIGCVGDLTCGPLVAGGTVVFMERFDPQAILDAVIENTVDCMLGIPTTLQIISELPNFPAADFSKVRRVCWGGAAMPANVLARYRAKGAPLGLTYGMSEVPGSITMSLPDADDRELTETVGHPVEQLDIRLVNDDEEVCSTGEEGEVRVKHDSILMGYYKRPEATCEAFDENGYFRTGDIGVLEPDGTMRLVGRKKDMFKSGGYNVYPREIEMVLEQHPQIATAAVVAVPDPTWQEVGWAFVIAPSDADPDKIREELYDLCKNLLANYKRPKRVIVRGQLPMLPVGKVDKVQLKQEALSES